MKIKLTTADEAKVLILTGKSLLVAGDEEVLKTLPRGNWIGGTIPYFMAADGGVITKDRVFINELPTYVNNTVIREYDETSINNVYVNSPQNGFNFIIIPASTPLHLSFAINAPNYPEFALRPLVGWIAGVHLEDLGKVTPKVFNGKTGEVSSSKAVVMGVSLPPTHVCDVGIVNIFSQGSRDTLEFLETGFSIKDVLVNGEKVNFSEYLLKNKIDTKLPLVANYGGASINISFQSIDEKSKTVHFYAPVFQGVEYKQADPIKNYIEDFKKNLPQDNNQILFSCNCILNFLYSELEGKSTSGITGPITFGEIAYQLLNQTMVYISVQKI